MATAQGSRQKIEVFLKGLSLLSEQRMKTATRGKSSLRKALEKCRHLNVQRTVMQKQRQVKWSRSMCAPKVKHSSRDYKLSAITDLYYGYKPGI